MANGTVHRTLTLRTAVSISDFGAANGGPGSLEAVLQRVHRRFNTIRQRRARFEGQIIEGRNVEHGRDISLLHLVAYTPDDQISVVPRAGNRAAADLALIDPPQNAEFLDGELMLLVRENDVAICRSNLGERAFAAYVHHLANESGMDGADAAFQLMKRADIDKIAMIQREGVKRVAMNSVAHAAAVDRAQRETVRETILGNVLDEVAALLGLEGDIPDDAENLKVEVLFTFDKRRGTEIDQRQLAYLAQQMLAEDEDEGFMIETLEGRRFRAQDIILSKPVRLNAYGKSVHYVDAWGELRAFYNELQRRP